MVTVALGLTRLHFERSLRLIARATSGMGPLLTHRFGLANIIQALQIDEQGSAMKVAVI